jgi:hypothetical protein
VSLDALGSGSYLDLDRRARRQAAQLKDSGVDHGLGALSQQAVQDRRQGT